MTRTCHLAPPNGSAHRLDMPIIIHVFGLCRYCGDELSRARRPLEICAACEGSPLCDRCGHPRSDHNHVFVRGVRVGCNRRLGDFQTGMTWSCDCDGFRPIVGGLSEASFAAASDYDDAPITKLRSALPRTKEHLA